MAASPKPADLAEFLHRIDSRVFHVPARPESMGALERLLALVLQGQGSYAVAAKCVRAYQEHFVSWNELRVARLFEVRDALLDFGIGDSQNRAVLTQQYLRRVFGLQNHLDLDWLYDASSERRETLLEALEVAPEHARFVLDLDSLDPEDEDYEGVPISPAMKRMFGRLGWAATNPKEADIRAALAPHLEGEALFPNFVSVSLLSFLLPVSKPKNCLKTAAILEIFKHRKSMSDDDLSAALNGMGFHFQPLNSGFGAAKKKVTKKKAAKKATKKPAVKKKPAAKKKVVKKKSGKKKSGAK
ncbi:MAG: hypothetical protein ACYTEP_09775 [Planctomycetota bacterium]|jgi:hypothetical protein